MEYRKLVFPRVHIISISCSSKYLFCADDGVHPWGTAQAKHGVEIKNIYEIADVVRNLSFKQKEKGLSTGEKKMLYNAKQILVSELVFAENSTQNEVEELIKIELISTRVVHQAKRDSNSNNISARKALFQSGRFRVT